MKKLLFILSFACGGQAVVPVDAGPDVTTADVTVDVVKEAAPPPLDGSLPPPPDSGTPTTNVYTFAMNKIYLGEISRGSTTVSSTAWKDFGENVDGLVTTASSTNVCTLALGAPKQNQVDGTGGIDNSWGETLLPIIQSATSVTSPSIAETAVIDLGSWTLQFQVVGLSDDPAQTAAGLTSQIFVGGTYSGTPAFDGTTDWPVLSTSVKDQATVASGATVQFASSYVVGGTFVSGGGPNPLVFNLDLQGVPFPLKIYDALITFDHSAHTDASNGTISGVLLTTDLIAALKAVAGSISTSLCGSAFDGIAQQIQQGSDIMHDGTNTSGVSCDAISIGLGFEAKLVANPDTVMPAPTPPPNPCGD